MNVAIDHLVIAAETLAQGAEYVQKRLGVDIPFGGVHPKMGTHNLLMQLGNTSFIEVIAINPDATNPAHPRWFGLDDAHIRRSLKDGPALLTWVVNTRNINSLMQNSSFDFGQAELISRGDLNWHFGLPEDGRLLAGGILPYVIQWQSDKHPTESMKDTGCKLRQLTLYHSNAAWLKSILESIGITQQIKVETLPGNATPYLQATIQTPVGTRKLRSV